MSVLDIYNYGKTKKNVRKLDYAKAYNQWYALLANKVLNIAKWENLPFEQRELEIRAQFMGAGYCGMTFSKRYKRLIAVKASGVGVTEYPDKWTSFIWACPGDSGKTDLPDGGVLIYNNSLMLPTSLLVEKYAHLLAHAELSLQAILINSRATGIIAARDNKQKEDVEMFYKALEDGKTLAIVDDESLDTLVGSEGLRHISASYPSSTSIMDYWQIRQNLYKEFLTELGISKSTDKRERMITDEIAQDMPLYQYSIDDMIQCRKRAAEEMNRIWGLNVSVDINPAIASMAVDTVDNIEKEGNNDVSTENNL